MSSSSSDSTAATLAAYRPQVTSACHITEASDTNDGNVGQGKFACSPIDLSYLVLHASTRPSAYSVVGIMGCQSTGKSTLLNLLFGTKFQEMDSSKGRSQTTKGVWVDSGDFKRDLVIMDLEGTDSGERGEDRTTFERQTSLYALAVAEVLIINMWEHDIGRYTASNYGILKTVFEVNLQLFDSQNKTILLFVIRDHIEEDTPMAQLIEKLHKEVDKIWSEIRKPEKFANTPVSDLFELRFFALPHMKLQKDLFFTKVGELKSIFTNSSNSEYLFASPSHGQKTVPADGFGKYMESCWTTIQSNKELNLPSQKEMLATFRCDEISTQLLRDVFQPALSKLKAQASEKLIANEYAHELNAVLREVCRQYNSQTLHYHREIVDTKRREFLTHKISDELEELFLSQTRTFLLPQMLQEFQTELNTILDAGGKSSNSPIVAAKFSRDFPHPTFINATQVARTITNEQVGPILAQFQLEIFSSAEGLEMSGLDQESHQTLIGHWVELTQRVERELASQIDSAVAVQRSQQLKKLPTQLEHLFKTHLAQSLTNVLKTQDPELMWDQIGELYRKVYEQDIEGFVIEHLCVAYQCTEEEKKQLIAQSEAQLSAFIRRAVEGQAGMIQVYMRSIFDRWFRTELDGKIRMWTSEHNIRRLFKIARDEALKQLDAFAVFRLDEVKVAKKNNKPHVYAMERMIAANKDPLSVVVEEDDDKVGQTSVDYASVDPQNIILDPAERMSKVSGFRLEIETALRDAETAQALHAQNTKIPLWMIGLVCFLGMDEILSILRNPFLLLLLILLGGGAYLAHQVGALFPLLNQAKKFATNALAQAQANLIVQAPVAAPTSSSSSSSTSRPSSSSSSSQVRKPAAAASFSFNAPATTSSSASHGRNPSLREYTEAESSPVHSRQSSTTSAASLPSSVRTKAVVEMDDLTPKSKSPQVEAEAADVPQAVAEEDAVDEQSAGVAAGTGSGMKKRSKKVE